MTYTSGAYHFRKYIENPKNNSSTANGKYTRAGWQEKANEAIGYIVNDNMTQVEAAFKANFHCGTVHRYYRRYLKENGYEYPISINSSYLRGKTYTQGHVKKLIDCIVNDNMSIIAAAKQLDMSIHTAQRYYRLYLDDPQRRIPTAHGSNRHPSHAQIRKAIGYLVCDKMSMLAASIKTDMSAHIVKKHYLKYLKDPEFKKIIDKE